MIVLSPPNFRVLSFPETKDTKHLANPAGHILHDIHPQVFAPRVDVYVSLRHKITENIEGIWCIERIAKGGTESGLAPVEANQMMKRNQVVEFHAGKRLTLTSSPVQVFHNDGNRRPSLSRVPGSPALSP